MRGPAAMRRRAEAMEAFIKWAGRACVTFVWIFCAVGYWSVWHYVFIPFMMYTGQEPLHILVLVLFHFLVVLNLYCYYRAIRTDPGFIQPGYLPPEVEEGGMRSVDVHRELPKHRHQHEQQQEEAEAEENEQREEEQRGREMKVLRGATVKSVGNINDDETKRLAPDATSDSDDDSESESDSDSDSDGDSDSDSSEDEDVEVVEPNYCRKCECYRPPRAHHCRHCKRCVLRMDHHCPWINNCVGHNNLKYFFLFLVYGACVGTMFLTFFGFCIYDLFANSHKYTSEQLWHDGIIVCVIVWIAGALTLNLAAMGCHTLALIITNTTSIEKAALRARMWRLRRRSNKMLRHKYDLGPQANLRQVLGSSPLQWFFPSPPETDGYHSPVYPNPNNRYELW